MATVTVSEQSTPEEGTSQRTKRLMIVTTVIGLLHHADHVLRADHSGFPFTPNVNEFTVSLLVAYPVAAFVFFKRGMLRTKVVLLTLTLFAVQAAHTFIELPRDQYAVWATNASIDPDVLGQPNLLNIASPAMGVLAVTISIALSVALAVTAYSAFQDYLQAKRR